MTIFTRDDGHKLETIDGFRDRALSYRKRTTPAPDWNDGDYAIAARKKIKRGERLIDQISRWCGMPGNTEVLEIGCGDGLNSILLGLHGVKRAAGIDIDLRLLKGNDQGESLRRLASEILKKMDIDKSLDQCLKSLPVELLNMDATRMELPDNSFDLAFSRSALEHIRPLENLFDEIRRVVRPRGMIYHEIDPFYWIRGCHKRGLVDIPWAHARLPLAEYHRFVTETEGERTADKRLERLKTLNRLTLREWKSLFEKGPFDLVHWTETRSEFAEDILRENPEVISTLLPGVETADLVVHRVGVWLRNRDK